MTYPTSKNLMAAFDPIDHRSPLPPIDIAPRKPITQEGQKSFLELQADEAEASERIARGERMWEITRQLAHGTNVAGGTVWEEVVEATPLAPAAEGHQWHYNPDLKVWSHVSVADWAEHYAEAQRRYLDGEYQQAASNAQAGSLGDVVLISGAGWADGEWRVIGPETMGDVG